MHALPCEVRCVLHGSLTSWCPAGSARSGRSAQPSSRTLCKVSLPFHNTLSPLLHTSCILAAAALAGETLLDISNHTLLPIVSLADYLNCEKVLAACKLTLKKVRNAMLLHATAAIELSGRQVVGFTPFKDASASLLLPPATCYPTLLPGRFCLPTRSIEEPVGQPTVSGCTIIPLAKQLCRAGFACLPAASPTDCPAPALQVAACALKGPAGALTSLLEDCTDSALELDRLLKEALLEQLRTSHEGLKGLAHAVLHGHLPFDLPELLRGEEGAALPSQLPVSIADAGRHGTCLSRGYLGGPMIAAPQRKRGWHHLSCPVPCHAAASCSLILNQPQLPRAGLTHARRRTASWRASVMDTLACLLMHMGSLCHRNPGLKQPPSRLDRPHAHTPACAAVNASRQGLLRGPVHLQACSSGQDVRPSQPRQRSEDIPCKCIDALSKTLHTTVCAGYCLAVSASLPARRSVEQRPSHECLPACHCRWPSWG